MRIPDHFPVWWGVCACGWQPDFTAGALKDQLASHLIDNGWVLGRWVAGDDIPD